MIERIYDVARVNEIVNDDLVYPWVHGSVVGPLDMAPVVEDRRNYCLFGEHGGVIYKFMQPGLYEAHTQVKRSGRGRWALSMVKQSFFYMFTRTEAVELMTRVPHGNIAAKALVKSFGSTFEFTRPNAWVKDHKLISADIYSYNISAWIREAEGLEEKGREFHSQLLEQYQSMGFKDALHPDDPNHDRYVGAAFSMVENGQPFKGAVFYNRWAAIAGFQEISILKTEPAIIDISEAILMFKNGVRVISCRQHSQSAA
jgi:hypothetical protein